jgi:hypothetical protein
MPLLETMIYIVLDIFVAFGNVESSHGHWVFYQQFFNNFGV